MGQLLLYTFLLIGAFQLPRFTLSDPATQQYKDGLTYLVDSPSKMMDPSGHILSIDFISGPSEDVMTSRSKRETISVSPVIAEEDKSAFTKKPLSSVTKKPTTTLIKSETANNVSTSMTTSMVASAATSKFNKTMTGVELITFTSTTSSPLTPSLPPSAVAPASNSILTKTFFKVTTMKPIVVEIVPVKVSSSFPGPKSNDSTVSTVPVAPAAAAGIPGPPAGTNKGITSTPNTTLTPPELYPEFPEFPPDYADFSKNNYSTKNDSHRYYNSFYHQQGSFLWVDLDNHPGTETHELLSNAHRRAATVKLEFDFPFYGHLVRNVTMATGGFIYLGEQVHAWLAATQYVAPLMANFDSRTDNVSSVRYLSNGSQFTVEWNQVHLHNSTDTRPFTFQTSLYKNGTIVFAYKEIPIEVKNLNDTHHPVKVGLSDAYITDKTILFVKSRTIFEYDRVDLKDYLIVNGSGIVFSALPTCLSYTNCQDCVMHETQFNCVWCPKANRCSDGTDRHRQDWIIKSCTFQSLDTRIACFIGTTSTENSETYRNFGHDDHDHDDNHLHSPNEDQYNHDHPAIYTPEKVIHANQSPPGMSASGITGLLFFFMLIFGVGGWVLYAYYYPHTTSGQLLIRFRPSQWGAFRRGEARYTAASIHM